MNEWGSKLLKDELETSDSRRTPRDVEAFKKTSPKYFSLSPLKYTAEPFSTLI